MIDEQIARLYGTLELKVDKWFREMTRVERSIEKLTKRTLKIRVELDTRVFDQQVARLQRGFGVGGGLGGGGGGMVAGGGGGGRWRSNNVGELGVMLSAEKLAARMAATRDRGAWANMVMDERAQNRANAGMDATISSYRAAQARRRAAEDKRIEREAMRDFGRQDRAAFANMLSAEREQNRANAGMDALIGGYRKKQAARMAAINDPNSAFSRRVGSWAEGQFGFVGELGVMGSAEKVAARMQAARAAATQYMGPGGRNVPGWWNNKSARNIQFGPADAIRSPMSGMVAGAAAYGIASGYKSAFDTAISTEASMAGIRRVTGFGKGQMGAVQQGLQQVAFDMPGMRRDDVFGVAFEAAKQGVNQSPEALVNFTRTMSQLGAIVDDMDVATLVTQMARMANIFDISQDRIGGMASAVVKLDQATTATVSDIINISGRLAGPAKALGIGLPGVLAVGAGIKDVGGANEASSSSMIRMFTMMASPKERSQLAGALGWDQASLKSAFDMDPVGTLGEMVKRVQMAPEGSDRLSLIHAAGIEGVRDKTMMGRMASGKWGNVANLEAQAAAEMESGSALAKGVEVESETTQAAIEGLTDALKNLMDASVRASGTLEVLDGWARSIGDAAQRASQEPDSFGARAAASMMFGPFPGFRRAVNQWFGVDAANAQMEANAQAIPGLASGPAGAAGLGKVAPVIANAAPPGMLAGLDGKGPMPWEGAFFMGGKGFVSPETSSILAAQLESLQRQRKAVMAAPQMSASIQDGAGLVSSQQMAILNGDIQRQQLAKLETIDQRIAETNRLLQSPMVNQAGATFQ